ncbi:hypothetical protein SOASR015_36830 [Pectobacterium carotovorum subsp. carotovorum]|nr:hypothetical protein SOASR015_36830 [Pectobacterium carotovorum subsp. carotovorum]
MGKDGVGESIGELHCVTCITKNVLFLTKRVQFIPIKRGTAPLRQVIAKKPFHRSVKQSVK